MGATPRGKVPVRTLERTLSIPAFSVQRLSVFDQVKVEDFRYRGQPSDAAARIALANSGELQIELIQLRNDAPSMRKVAKAAENWAGADPIRRIQR